MYSLVPALRSTSFPRCEAAAGQCTAPSVSSSRGYRVLCMVLLEDGSAEGICTEAPGVSDPLTSQVTSPVLSMCLP